MCQIPMEQLSPEIRAIARNNRALLFQRLSDHGQNVISKTVEISETKMSRLKGAENKPGDLELFAILAAVMGIKLVDDEAIYCDKEMAGAVATFMRHASASPEFVNILFGGTK